MTARPQATSSASSSAQQHSLEKLHDLAFPWMTRDLRGDALHPGMQQGYRDFISCQDVAWMNADLSFLSTHSIKFVDCGGVAKTVNAFSVGFHSPFYNSLFKYSQQNSIEIRLDWLTCICQGLSTALDAISSRECRVELTEVNCLQLFMAADFILCQQLRSQSLEFIGQRCAKDSKAALAVWEFARHFNLPELVGASLKHVLQGFQELRQTDEFLELDAAPLREVLCHRMLNCNSELQILQAVGQWLQRHPGWPADQQSDSSPKASLIEELLCCVRVSQLHSEELQSALDDPLVRSCPDFADFIRAYPLPTAFSRRNRARLSGARQARWPQKVLLLLGGWYKRQGPAAYCQVYDPRGDAWDLRRSPEQDRVQQAGWLDERSHACGALLGHVFHMIGGYSGSEALKSVLCFDKRRHELGWYEGSCMLQPRYYHCCAALNGFLYAIGGQTSERRLTHVERMRGADNSWVSIEPMRRPRCEAAAVAFRGKLLVVGGYDGRAHLDTAEIYCPDTGAWTLVTGSMTQARTGHSLLVFDGAIFALCGRNANGWRNCVERSEDGRLWKPHCEMTRARSNFGCEILDDKIFLLGGISGSSEKDIMPHVEWLEPRLKTVGAAHPMPFPASGLTTCVIDLANFADCCSIKGPAKARWRSQGLFQSTPMELTNCDNVADDDTSSDGAFDEAVET